MIGVRVFAGKPPPPPPPSKKNSAGSELAIVDQSFTCMVQGSCVSIRDLLYCRENVKVHLNSQFIILVLFYQRDLMVVAYSPLRTKTKATCVSENLCCKVIGTAFVVEQV